MNLLLSEVHIEIPYQSTSLDFYCTSRVNDSELIGIYLKCHQWHSVMQLAVNQATLRPEPMRTGFPPAPQVLPPVIGSRSGDRRSRQTV